MKNLYLLLVALFILTGCEASQPARFSHGDYVAVYRENSDYLQTGVVTSNGARGYFMVMDRNGIQRGYYQHELMFISRPKWDVKVLNRRGGFYHYKEDGDEPDYIFR